MSEENNNNQPTESTTETIKIAEPDFSSYKDFKTILDKLNPRDAPISATISAQDCPIEALNVFASGTGSEVTRTVTTKLPAGLHKVVITDLSPLAYDLNFRIGGKKGFLLDANLAIHEEPRPVDPKKIERQKAKKEKLNKLNEERTNLGIEITNNRAQISWINDYANKAKESLGSTVKLEDAVNFMNFYGERIKALHTESAQLETKLKEVNDQIAKLNTPKPQPPQQILTDLAFQKSMMVEKSKVAMPTKKEKVIKKKIMVRKQASSDSDSDTDDDYYDDAGCGTTVTISTDLIRTKRITVTIFLTEKTKLRLHTSYQLPNLTYQVSYESHFISTSSNSELLYYVTLINASGEKLVIDKETKVTITDGKHSQFDVTHPNAYLSIGLTGRDDNKFSRFMSSSVNSNVTTSIPMVQAPIQQAPISSSSSSSSSIFSRSSRQERSQSSTASAPPVIAPQQPAQPQVAVTTHAISIKDQSLSQTLPVTLPEYTPIVLESNSEQQRLVIGAFKMSTNLTYTCLPKSSQNAFIVASTVNNSSFPLFRGQVKVFVDNNFVQTSYINYTNPKDDFSLQLGYDPEIQVEFKQEQTMESKSSKTKQINLIQTISIKNKKSNDIELHVYDIIPTSTHSDVKLNIAKPNLKEDKTVTMVENANQLKWVAKIASGKFFAAQTHYQIEAPLKGEVVFQ